MADLDLAATNRAGGATVRALFVGADGRMTAVTVKAVTGTKLL
jgi:hypothetical protein